MFYSFSFLLIVVNFFVAIRKDDSDMLKRCDCKHFKYGRFERQCVTKNVKNDAEKQHVPNILMMTMKFI